MTNSYNNFYKALNVIFDYFLLNISLIIVYNFSHKTIFNWLGDKTYGNVVLILNLLWLFSANMLSLYIQDFNDEYIIIKKSIKTYVLYVMLICYMSIYLNNINTYHVTRDYLFISVSLFGLLFVACKLIFLNWVKRSGMTNGKLKRAVIVGGGRAGLELCDRFKSTPRRGYELLGIFDNQPLSVPTKHLYLGDTASCISYVKANNVNEIFCTLPFSESETIKRLIIEADKNLIRFKLVPEHYEYFKGALLTKSLNKIDAFSIRIEPLENIMNRFIKRLFDVAFSLCVLIFILSWLYPLIFILIKLESEGPVIFVQPRSGRDNMPFNCYKFRSMRINSDSHRMQATKGDSRITKVGAFLRKTSLDEMPQFFNVLIGNMSVVGPRPHMLSHTVEYSNLIDHFMVRHFIKPGITGWAQVTGLRGETKLLDEMCARVEADVWYMENWSFTLDLRIIFSTLFKTITGDKYAF